FGAAMTDASAHLLRNRLGANRDAVMRELFGPPPGIGLGLLRVPIGASDFSMRHYTFDDLPAGATDSAFARFSIDADRADKLPALRQALAINPRLAIVASPWSAPAWMKTSGSLIGGTLRPEHHGSFAEYLVRFVEGYAAEGVPVFALTLQNEPAFEPGDYPGMRLDPWARAVIIGRHLGPLLERRGLRTRILEWDHNWDQSAAPLAVLADSAARRYVSGVAWHCYAGNVAAQDSVHAAHPDKDAYFTECSGGGWATVFGDNLRFDVGTLIIGATRGWARGVAFWNLALDETGGPHLGGCGNCRGVITIDSRTGAVTRNVEYYALAHASRFVRPGARRIASATDVRGVQSVAFRNADDRSTGLIVLNTGASDVPVLVRDGTRGIRYLLRAGAVATLRWR
ncbi:MAG TPA: glycoside hydrolase family 30 beta sandwich domain-containing protein, partial [Gemmatimonadaceae bacterium]|nr:glycoside hydrolase family 30 beta sandwich domain-containing protein [Gemmatimonadaceae bacterium]